MSPRRSRTRAPSRPAAARPSHPFFAGRGRLLVTGLLLVLVMALIASLVATGPELVPMVSAP